MATTTTEWKKTTLGECFALENTTVDPAEEPRDVYSLYSIPGYDAGAPESLVGADIKSNKFVVPNPSVLFSKLNPSTPRVWSVRDPLSNAICSTEFFPLTPKSEVDYTFGYYLLLNPSVTREMSSSASGTSGSHQRIRPSDLLSLTVRIPPLPIQQSIGAVLSSLDNKLELLRRQNETLEQIAQTIFNEWFVKSGNAVVPLHEIVEINPSTPLKKGTRAAYFDMKALPTKGSWPERPIELIFSSGSKFQNGDALLARITPCLENGKAALVQCLPDGAVAWGSTEFIVMRTKPTLPPAFGYLLARSEPFRDFAIRVMSGTSGRQRVQVDMLANYEIALPTKDVISKFSHVTETIFAKIKNNSQQGETLAALRDVLLPQLMSGELSINT